MYQRSRRETAPIIIKFVKKNDRMSFYYENKKAYNLQTNQIVSSVQKYNNVFVNDNNL